MSVQGINYKRVFSGDMKYSNFIPNREVVFYWGVRRSAKVFNINVWQSVAGRPHVSAHTSCIDHK